MEQSDAADRRKNQRSDTAAKSGWVELKIPHAYGQGTNFLHGRGNTRRLKVRYFNNVTDGAFMGKIWFGPAAEGPPGYAHGGSIAAVCDEAMGLAVWKSGFLAVTARIEIDYRSLVPLNTTAEIKVWIHRKCGRTVVAKGKLMNADGTVYSEAKGLFVSINPERFGLLKNAFDKA
jgi:acyl-coenzyme A thioesterase PaaI-like protein